MLYHSLVDICIYISLSIAIATVGMHISQRNGLFGSKRNSRRGNLVHVSVCPGPKGGLEVSQVSKMVLGGL